MGISRDISERKKMEEKLQELSKRDYLTGLFNDRYFYEKLGEEIDRFKRYKEVFSLLYIDIDGFKLCNDTYGHLEGDKVLRILSKILQRSLRKVDSAYRIGGEEFVVMLPHTSKEEAGKVAERICEDVHQRLYPRYGITVSIGVADSKVDDVVRTADEAMYEAKRRGKNRVWVAG
jgi:diguanylate cyclase (GGDEF)-like protein